MADLYSTRVTATGGRHGSIRSDDGLLALQLALPRTLGGKGGATNPEQLFAGGIAACFGNARLRGSRGAGRQFGEEGVYGGCTVGPSGDRDDTFLVAGALAR